MSKSFKGCPVLWLAFSEGKHSILFIFHSFHFKTASKGSLSSRKSSQGNKHFIHQKIYLFFLFLSRVVEGKAPRVHLAPLCLEKVILFTKGVSIECLETKNQSTRYITQGANENSKWKKPSWVTRVKTREKIRGETWVTISRYKLML